MTTSTPSQRLREFANSTPFCAGTVAQALRSFGSVLTDAADRIDPPPGPPPDPAHRVISPRPGPQSEFLASEADVAFMVGGPWTGKTFALLSDWLRHAGHPCATGLIVCRRRLDIIWDEAKRIYAGSGVQCQTGPRMRMTWPSGATLEFGCTESIVHHQEETRRWVGIHDAHEISTSDFSKLVALARGPGWRVRAIASAPHAWAIGRPRMDTETFDTHACDIIPPDGMTRAQALARLRMGDPSAFAGES